MWSQENQIILNISKLQSLTKEVVTFPDNQFSSNCLAPEDIKEDLLQSVELYKDDLKEAKDLDNLEKTIKKDILETENNLKKLKSGENLIFALFI